MPLRPTASTPPTVAPSAGGQRHGLTALGERGVELGDRRARAAPHGHLLRLDPRRCPPARAPRVPGRHRAADVPLRAAADTRDRRRRHRPSSASAVRSTRPPGTRCRSPQRLPAGRTLAGWRRRRDRTRRAGAPGVEVVGGEQQRHEVALLEPDAVLARQHAAGGDATPRRSRRPPRAPAPARPARARRTRAAGGGCRRRRGTRSSR